ncbi:AraC family transcriptional regulator [Nocardia huaxiensis]|uniref:AraC family transcriptional regulator n=1 Tax=Nocardia huaxiensis TaxID=2755382 RepID=A0A7D6VAJ2_9NOCA|nr:AraC family transcriptional regulator [Nocardia huaxiensis]QLY30471.1 AraC family transcriptional regulator [Nocardia huaxiensis]
MSTPTRFDWDLRRSTASVHVLTQLAQERGMPVAACLAGTGVKPSAVIDPRTEITARQELAVVRNLLARFGDEPGLGVAAGGRMHVSLYGNWGLALLSSATLRDALRTALDYLELAFAVGPMRLYEADGQARLRLDDTDIPEDVRPFFTERTMAAVQVLGRELFGLGVPADWVSFRHPTPSDLTRHREIFGVDPLFEAQATEAAFNAGFLDLPLPQADEWVRGTYERLCQDMLLRRRLARRPSRGDMTNTVREVLMRDPRQMSVQATVAAELYISSRTMSRRLQDEGTCFRALLEEVRETVAEQLLHHTDLTTGQISHRLGYAEPAAFIRAFRRWKGCPPQQYRVLVNSTPPPSARTTRATVAPPAA